MSPPARAEPATGTYIKVSEIAQGGMGYVELVLRREGTFQRLYARKRLHVHYRLDPSFRAMFVDEARLAGLVRHPNVVSVLDVGEDPDGPFLIMDFVEGLPVSRLISRAADEGQGVPLQVAVRIVIEAARGLHAAHELKSPGDTPLGLVHRDVSPQNILVGYDGSVRVTDFGIAKAFGNVTRTATGVLKGNMAYLSPEQLRFEEIDRRADLFSLGVVLYELLAGSRLYATKGDFDGPRRILHEPAPDIGEVRDDVPPELVELLFELLTKERDRRPPTAADVGNRLEAILAPLIEQEGALPLAEYMKSRFEDTRQEQQRELDEYFSRTIVSTGGGSVGVVLPAAAPRARRLWLTVVPAVLLAALGTIGVRVYKRARPGSFVVSPDEARSVAAGGWHTCAEEGGRLYCWGRNGDGQLGIGTQVAASSRQEVVGIVSPVSMGLGYAHTCACVADGRVFCWGRNKDGQLGTGNTELATRPQPVPGVTDCKQVAAGSYHTCVLRANGQLACWGRNDKGQLGSPPPGPVLTPTPVPGVSGATQVVAHGDWGVGFFSCALLADGGVLCWGDNDRGQLGDGTRTAHTAPAPVVGLTDVVELAAGGRFACARRRSGAVVCWGGNGRSGSLGHGTTNDRVSPAEVLGLTDAVRLTAGLEHACALRKTGELRCWGENGHGQLGAGSQLDQLQPIAVQGIDRFRTVAAGEEHVCARHEGGVACWGSNDSGQLGDGTTQAHTTPMAVAGF